MTSRADDRTRAMELFDSLERHRYGRDSKRSAARDGQLVASLDIIQRARRAFKWLGAEIGSDSAVLGGGIVLAQGILLAATPALSRLYGPQEFGSAAKILAIVATVSVIATGRFELSIMLPASRDHGYAVFCLCAVAACGGAVVAAMLLAVLSPWFSLGALAWALPLGLAINGLSTASTYWLLRERSFVGVAIGRVGGSLVTAGTQVIAGFAGAPVAWVLILTAVVGPGAMVVVALRRGGVARPGWPAWHEIGSVAKTYRRFPLVEAGGALFGTLGNQLPVLLISAWFPPARVGAFFMAQRLLTAPVSLVGAALGQVFFQRASARAHSGQELWALTFSVFRRLVLIGIIPLIVVVGLGRPLFVWLLGRSWADTGRFAQLLALSAFFQLTYSPLSTLFAVRQRQGSALIVHLLLFSVPLLALVGGRAAFQGSLFPIVALLGGSTAVLYFGLSMWNLALARESVVPAAVVDA